MYIIYFYYVQGIIMQFFSQIIVSAKNPIHRIASQIILFQASSFIFMLKDQYFLGITYIIVYVGAIAIQFLFVIMLIEHPSLGYNYEINSVIKNPHSNSKSTILESDYNKKRGDIKLKYKFIEKIQNDNIKINKIGYKEIITEYQDIFKKKRNEKSTNISIVSIILITVQQVYNIYLNYYNNSNFLIYDIIKENYFSFINMFNLENPTYQGLDFKNSYNFSIYNYFYPNWTIEFKTISDIETQGIMIYISYPIIQIQISVALWTVMIGIISICSPRK